MDNSTKDMSKEPSKKNVPKLRKRGEVSDDIDPNDSFFEGLDMKKHTGAGDSFFANPKFDKSGHNKRQLLNDPSMDTFEEEEMQPTKSAALEKFNFDAYDPSDAQSPLGMDFVVQEKEPSNSQILKKTSTTSKA